MTAFTYGLEFEVEGISTRTASDYLNEAGITCDRITNDIHATHDLWKVVPDGSLNGGAEVVSPILDASRLNEGAKVAKVLSAAGARVGSSTGYHVHVGYDAFRPEGAGVTGHETLGAFVLNYYAVHHAFGALVAPSRLTNRRYCRILDRERAEGEAQWVRDGNLSSRLGDRYTSLNLDALQRHGTVEVRLHQGTLNGVKAVAWVQLMTALINATKAGLDLSTVEALHPWAPVGRYGEGHASADDCRTLLDLLTGAGHLSASTADWLKGRAAKLNP